MSLKRKKEQVIYSRLGIYSVLSAKITMQNFHYQRETESLSLSFSPSSSDKVNFHLLIRFFEIPRDALQTSLFEGKEFSRKFNFYFWPEYEISLPVV